MTEIKGNKELPAWIRQGEALEKRVQNLMSEIDQAEQKFKEYAAQEHELPMVITATISQYVRAEKYRRKIVNLLNCDGSSNVIGFRNTAIDALHTKRQMLSIATNVKLFENMRLILQDTAENADLISSIVSLKQFEPEIIHYSQNNTAYRVTLIDFCDNSKNQLAQTEFEKQCEKNGIIIKKKTRYTADNVMYRIVIRNEVDVKAVCSIGCVSSIETAMPLQAEPLEVECVRYTK